ncbi:GNAT family N-acetyltransferase [uncultured Sphingomonas sp.]|uniref:GNAT family N-acetyltransferase n=1 Tax=uncultured Sphingomonas sp. TaxID=158754 RepID=UPI00260A1B3A|nr:GNAT family N-acetyltransferase [uncultured Sphingomonas sp.]
MADQSTTPARADDISIVAFEPRHAAAFSALNIAWLERFFAVEDKDREQLGAAQARVIDKGGAILIAEDEAGVALGCVALIPYAEGELELAKMAVAEAAQGRGVGRKLMDAAIARAQAMGARSLYLESNKALIPAITLYERSGFQHLAPEARPKSPYARCDVYMRRAL